MTLVLGALEGEIAAFLTQVQQDDEQRWNGYRFVRGTLDGHPVVVARSGVGKSLAAAVTQHLIDRYVPRRIVFTGLAGAISTRLEIGDTLVARDCLQYDMDATALGFKLGQVPYTAFRVLRCAPELVAAALGYTPQRGALHVGRVLTGDRFLVDADSAGYRYLQQELAGDAVEMEGASVGLVARLNRVPFLIVRTISDKADGKSGLDLRALLDLVSGNSLACVRHLLGALAEDPQA